MNRKREEENFYRAQILAVDDEPAILRGVRAQLSSRGYEVKTATGGRQALEELVQSPPDLILLDLMMPQVDGLEVIRQLRLRLHSNIPVIVLSAMGEEQQKVEALDMGADDYLTKPFGVDELLARIRVALRHKRESAPPAPKQPLAHIVGNEELSVDLTNHRVFREGQEVKLTPRQYDLLAYLALHPEKLITHRELLQNLWGPEYGNETQYVHVFIAQLRQKLEPDPSQPRFIRTEPGLGYRFFLPGDEGED